MNDTMEYIVKKTYKGCISLRSPMVDNLIESNTTVEVKIENEKGVMILTPNDLANPLSRSSQISSQFNNETYHLLDYKWNPIINDEKQKKLVETLGNEWYKKIGYVFDTDWMKKLAGFIQKERITKKHETIFPVRCHTDDGYGLRSAARQYKN